jgi:hypothetical protein
MARPGTEQVNTTDTFQSWLDTTNELVDLVNAGMMTASTLGDTTEGNATLIGSFTANTVNVVGTMSANTASVLIIQNKDTINSDVSVISPINIATITENMLTLTSPASYKPNLRLVNGSNTRWVLSHSNSLAASSFVIQTEGASSPQVSITQNGRVIATEFQGDGSNITNLNASAIPNLDASKITAGSFDAARIPNLDASKITSGSFDAARIPNLDGSKITTGTVAAARIASLDASKITTGSFDAARIPNLDGSKITTGTIEDIRLPSTAVRTSRILSPGAGISISGNGDLSADRTISITTASTSEIRSLSGTNKIPTTSAIATALALTTPSGASWTPDWSSFISASWVLTDNRTLLNPTNVTPGTTRVVRVSSDSATSRTISYDTAYKGFLTPSVTNTAVAIMTLYAVSSSEIVVSAVEYVV